MIRYVRRPHAWVERDSDDVWMPWEEGQRHSMTVSEPEAASQFSGIYDADGTPLYRQESTRPIGFLKQWDD
jgi:hypothetical protein